MVFLENLNSIIEATYLGESLSDNRLKSNIYVNPENVTYLTGKTIVINDLYYSDEYIDYLINTQCTVISRLIQYQKPGVIFQPYIIRPNFNVMWNGITLNTIDQLTLEEISEYCTYLDAEKKLLFPKIESYLQVGIELTGVGWALHQVGVNLVKDTVFTDMDVIKTKKL